MQNEIEKKVLALEQRVRVLEDKFLPGSKDIVENETKKVSIKEFLITKRVDDDVKRTLVITYFSEHIEKNDSVNTDDLKKYFNLAKCQLPKNINDKVNMNIKNAHMMEASTKKDNKKAWILTATGEQFVENELNK